MMASRCLLAHAPALPLFNNPALNNPGLRNTAWD